ncbi:MAG: M20 family metallopeptidase [Clostridia bacterium]|nr:M20 family metallopeptidase [Clostridia bacterium]
MADHAVVREALEKRRDRILALSHDIHAHPEVAHEERRSAKLLVDYLRSEGFRVEEGIAGFPTAFRAEAKVGEGGPTVAVLAEYDALPEIGHACGHNMIAAVGVGSGAVLKEALEATGTAGTVVVLGTPAEELPPPVKAIMFDRGAFEGIDFVLMFHGGDRTTASQELLALDALEFHFKGVPSHAAASPEAGRSALDGATITQVAIEFLREHLPQETRIHGIVIDGGESANTVPERAALRYFVRAPRRRHVDEASARVKDCARAGALAAGVELEIREIGKYHNRINVKTLNERLVKNAVEAGAEQVLPPAGRASNDSGWVSWNLPVGGLSVAFVPVGTGGHSHAWVEAAGREEGDRAVCIGIHALAATGLDLCADRAFREAVQAEFPKALAEQR